MSCQTFRPKGPVTDSRRSFHARLLAVAGLTATAVVALPAHSAHAAAFGVPCSVPALVSAINTANSTPGTDALNLASGCTYKLVAPDNGANGLPAITSDITINGRGATITRNASAPSFRILNVASGAALTISAATISGGRSADCPDASDPGVDSCGGGVLSHGTLTVNQSRIINNTATSSANGGIFVEGGGIENIAGATTVSRSEVSGNTASYTGSEPFSAAFGGGIGNETSLTGDQGSLTVDQSRLVDNTVSATGSSGGIGDGGFAEGGAIDNFAPAKVDRSVISNNHSIAPDSGSARAAGVLNGIGASMSVSRTAVTDNTASAPNGEAIGGGIQSNSRTATLILTDSIVSGNTLNVTGAGSAIGAGIDNSFGTVTISNVLVTDNAARTTGGSAAGGGLRNRGTTSLTHVIVSDNTAAGSTALGGGIRNSGGAGPLTLTRSAVTHNSASGTAAAGGGISDATSPSTVTITMTAVFGNRPDNCSPPNGTCN